MPKKPASKRRTKVKDLPKGKEELSKGEQKKVKGGSVTDLVIDPFNPSVVQKRR